MAAAVTRQGLCRVAAGGKIGTSSIPLVAVTAGEPAGIGPELCVMLTRRDLPARVVVIADPDLLRARARLLGLPLTCAEFDRRRDLPSDRGHLSVFRVPLARPSIPGKLDPANSRYVLRTLELAADGCVDGSFDALATAPVHKGVINETGIPFTGHTEFLAARTGAPHVVMMLAGGGLRVALVTTHLQLKDVARHITAERLEHTLRTLHRELSSRFGLAQPRIVVAGLNPHAGESGHLGREEIDVIIPVLNMLRTEGFEISGPLPADTLFNPERLRGFDCVVAMYHDQGLPVLKYASFGSGVNVTLGLPIIRTSVDHGTALDIAGTGTADPGSLIAAIELAAELAQRERHRRDRSPATSP
jgi:4-hydroxythreonine-4-phosphate dehydrogenase